MERIGYFFIFKPHFDNVPEFSRLYTFSINQSINQSINFIADKLHPYKSSGKKNQLSRTGAHTINFSSAATRET